METDATDSAVKPKPPVLTFGGIQTLREQLGMHFGKHLGVPNLQENDLYLLDDAVALLCPSEAQVRVVEVDTFMESERSIVKGDAMIGGRDSFSCRQMVVILKRVAGMPDKGEEAGTAAAPEAHPSLLESGSRSAEDSKAKEGGSAIAEPELAPTASVGGPASTDADAQDVDADWQELPEIILFWGRNRRSGGNLVVCPENSMDRLIQAYLVCEVVEDTAVKKSTSSTRDSFRDGIMPEREGALMGVELGEATTSEQDALGNLLSDYSFHDASIGIVSLSASIYYFGPEGRNDVNVLTLLAVAVVAGLNQEATWPWVFKHILHCSSIKDPLVRVCQCRRVHHHQGQLSGQGFLAIGLAVFGVYLEVFPADDGDTPLLFRILLNVFQGGMIAVLVVNMVQAVEPMAMANMKPMDRLRRTSRELLRENVFDTAWYLTLMVALVWGGIIAAVVTQLSYEPEHLGWSIAIVCIVVFSLSVCTVNPGMALLGMWALVWLIPTGLALVLRSAFDTTMLVINRVSLVSRRMAREVSAHAGSSMRERISVRGFLFLLLQVLPLTPLLVVYLPLPLLYVLSWFLHVSLRLLLLVADAIVYPLSPLRLYPLLSDYGSVTWKMGRLDMDVEESSMRTLLKGRVSKLMETSGLGARVNNGVLPAKPYAHLNAVRVPRLGCAAIVQSQEDETERVLFVSPTDRARKGGGGKSATDGS